MPKHTPGPWKYGECKEWSGDRMYGQVRTADDRIIVNGCAPGGTNEADANCRIMAASLAMLELLIELTSIEGPQPGTSEWASKVRAVIAKATEPNP